MAVKVQTATGETFVSTRLKVGDYVQVTAAFADASPASAYIGRVGVIHEDDDSTIPFRVYYKDISESQWFRERELILAPAELQTIDSIKHTVLDILDGKVFYTPDGTKIHMQEGILKYGEKLLNLERLVVTPLTSISPIDPPFEIDPIRGTHCQVWNSEDDKNSNIYRLITGYDYYEDYKFTSSDRFGWKYAVPVK